MPNGACFDEFSGFGVFAIRLRAHSQGLMLVCGAVSCFGCAFFMKNSNNVSAIWSYVAIYLLTTFLCCNTRLDFRCFQFEN